MYADHLFKSSFSSWGYGWPRIWREAVMSVR
jgi:hypothetical protein